MTLLIILFGALILLAGIVIVIKPEVIFGFLQNNLDKPALHILAVVIRIVLGALLISQSSISQFPFVIEFLGWLTVVAAMFLAVMGRRNFRRLMSWAVSFSKPFGRVGGILATSLGLFLIYAFV